MSGNGSGTSWAAASICSTVVLALGGAFGSSYVRDQNRAELAIRALEAQRDQNAYVRGIVEQRLDQLTEIAEANREMIVAGLRALDEGLQREMRILDDATVVQIANMDKRLQGEVQALVAEQRARVEALQRLIEELMRDRWTRTDQKRFEDQLGLRLAP